jgi:flagellar assembly protein FliH
MEAHGNRAGVQIETLEYPACPGEELLPAWDSEEDLEGDEGDEKARNEAKGAAPALSGEQMAEESRRSFEAGRERGRQEGRQAEHKEQAAALAAEEQRYKQQIAGLAESFATERDRFLHAVEQEVVKLALAVAARILRREAQMDPLLLTGAVRVALGQLAGTAEVTLKVPAAELDLWKETIAVIPHLNLKVEVIAGEGMRTGDCVVESKVGTVDLGVRSQLGEIERGFFDRARSGELAAAQISIGGEVQG